MLRSCPRKRASRAKNWVPAFRLRSRFGGLPTEPVEAAWRRRVAGTSGVFVATTALALHLGASTALACACCSNTASRYVEVEKLSAQRTSQIDEMRFAKAAKLATGEADAAIRGVTDPATDYQLGVARAKERMTFSFRDTNGRAGTLTLAMPATISIFEVDPRGLSKDEGLGPVLYKEWKLTADARGDGLFHGVTGAGQKLTLVLHGAGRGCTDATHFTDWTLLIHGRDRLTLYGALEQ